MSMQHLSGKSTVIPVSPDADGAEGEANGYSSRRRFLHSSLGAAGVLAVCPINAFANSAIAQGDTPIKRLWAECEALSPEVERLSRALDEAYERFRVMSPPLPEEMYGNEVYAHIVGLKLWLRRGYGDDNDVMWISTEGWRHAVNRPLVTAEQGPMAPSMWVTHERARAREVLPIAERHEAEVEAARAAAGVKAADDAYEQASARLFDLGEAILASEAETFADLLVQVKVCEARDYDDDEFAGDDAMALLRSIKHLAQRVNAAGEN